MNHAMRHPVHPLLILCAVISGIGVAAASPQNNRIDLDGTPDLVVRTEYTEHQWVVRDEKFAADLCSVVEGGIDPGTHRVVRFSVGTANIGDADLYLGNPQDHINANDGLYEFALCHQHYHFRHYATYELVDPATGRLWRAAKRGFCMLDSRPDPAWMGEPAKDPNFEDCGTTTEPGNQGISHGWTDVYDFKLGGQFFVLDGGDGQEIVPPGAYIIRITVNPPFVPQGNEPCRFLDTKTGLCHNLPESDYSNNIGEIPITIPTHPGRGGFGPLSGSPNEATDIPER